MKRNSMVTAALVLTLTGFMSRILGFFYRIFLSRTIGAEGLGIYQMIFPIYGICFSLCAGSIQTAISRFTAADEARAKKTLLAGFSISFTLSLILASFIWRFSGFLAEHILMEPRCAPLLPALALAIPCTSVHACICGYYYGKEKVHIPAFSQLVEQCIRIFTVFLLADICREKGIQLTVSLAVAGLVAGEAGSALFTLLSFLLCRKEDGANFPDSAKTSRLPGRHGGSGTPGGSGIPGGSGTPGISKSAGGSILSIAGPLAALAMPLMANRLVMNLLQSAEAILIPSRLAAFGLSQSQAISIYGVLTGMAMSFIMFPSTIANSLAVVLLPTVARDQSSGNDTGIQRSIAMSFRYSLYMGILCIGIFTVFGENLGMEVFRNQDAGVFITILAWLCPFLYLATTMGSILNGLGKTSATFFHNLAALLLRLGFVIFGIPRFGIYAYLWGMLASELLLSLLHILALKKTISFSPNPWEVIVKPVFCLVAALGIFRLFPVSFSFFAALPQFFTTAVRILIVCAVYCLVLLLFHRGNSRQAGESVKSPGSI